MGYANLINSFDSFNGIFVCTLKVTMSNSSKKIIIRSSINFISAFIGVVGFIFWLWIFYITIKGKAADETSKTAQYILAALFLGFALWAFTLTARNKVIILTEKQLIIKWPFLLLKKNISLLDINQITEKPYKVTYERDNMKSLIYNGKEATLTLKNGRKVKFNSFETFDYEELLKKLYIAKNRAKLTT